MPRAKTYHLTDEAGMANVAADIAPLMAHGGMLRLEGDLGAGKTALARALIRNLTGNPALDVPSPTFTLLQTYDHGAVPIWHFDFYRLKHADEAYELGWEDALAGPAIILMEWAARIEALLPPGPLITIRIIPMPDGTRQVEVTA